MGNRINMTNAVTGCFFNPEKGGEKPQFHILSCSGLTQEAAEIVVFERVWDITIQLGKKQNNTDI